MHWPSIDRVTRIRIPILFIVGQKDELVPSSQGQQLFEAAGKTLFKERLLVPNGTHNETWHIAGSDYAIYINNFKARAFKELAGVKVGGGEVTKEEALNNMIGAKVHNE